MTYLSCHGVWGSHCMLLDKGRVLCKGCNIFIRSYRVTFITVSGVYLRESKEVFDFISQLISQAKRRGEF